MDIPIKQSLLYIGGEILAPNAQPLEILILVLLDVMGIFLGMEI